MKPHNIMENSDIKYLDIFFSPIQINQLDLNIDSLIKFCYEMKRKDEKGGNISNIGGWQSKNVVNEVHEEFTKLKIEVEKFANEYHRELEFKETLQQKIGNIWTNINQKGDSNEYHVHPFSALSGCFYMNANTPIVFEHPYSDITTYYWGHDVIENWNEANSGEWKIEPYPNILLIFPPWLRHKVVMNTEDTDRISISFNTQFV